MTVWRGRVSATFEKSVCVCRCVGLRFERYVRTSSGISLMDWAFIMVPMVPMFLFFLIDVKVGDGLPRFLIDY